MSTEELSHEITLARRELKNIRQQVYKQKGYLKAEIEKIEAILKGNSSMKTETTCLKCKNQPTYSMTPIGVITSCFKSKNGIPRQSSLCHASKAILEINKTHFTNPEHALIGLSESSYIWILFVFHDNGTENFVKAKVHPPRLDGLSVGVFATRSPHRPCPLGLSLTKLDKIIGNTLYISGIDMLDGTPVLDIKPYIPSYDMPRVSEETLIQNHLQNLLKDDKPVCKENTSFKYHDSCKCCDLPKDQKNRDCKLTLKADGSDNVLDETFLLKEPPSLLEVNFTSRALDDLKKFHTSCGKNCQYCLNFVAGSSEAKLVIEEILQNDPRSVYRRNKCSDKLYYFEIDNLHITCWFDDFIAEVLRVKPKCEIKF